MKWSRPEASGARLEHLAGWAALFVTAVAVWWFNIDHLQSKLASDGFSPTYIVSAYLHPDWFVNDFPSGAAEMLKSLPFAVYLLMASLGVPLVPVMKGLIALEIVILAGATLWAGKRILPNASTLAVLLTAVLMIAGSLRMPDLGRWGDPMYGWVYNYAEAATIVGIAALLERRLLVAAVAFSLSFASHAVLGVLGCLFGAAILIADWRQLNVRALAIAASIFFLITGGWFVLIASSTALGGGGIPADLYIAMTRMEGVHWYPVDMGLFWERHWERLVPFVATSLLLLTYGADADGKFYDRRMVAGFATMLALTGLGIGISVWIAEPFLIKLALHRASSIYLLLALFYVVPGLWRDAREGDYWRGAFAVLAILSAFLCSYGMALVFALVLSGDTALSDAKRGITKRTVVLLIAITISVGLILYYAIGGIADWSNSQYWGLSALSIPRLAVIAVLVSLFLVLRHARFLPAAFLFLVLTVFAGMWAHAGDRYAKNPALLAQENSYLAAQIWAQENTPAGSLFMVDPASGYGWRSFSLRPSFGTAREWLYAGWLYNSRKDTLESGIQRVKTLGLDVHRYLKAPAFRPGENGERLNHDLRTRYNSLTARDLSVLADKFGIAYFVFDRRFRPSAPKGASVVYQNDHYFVLQAEAQS